MTPTRSARRAAAGFTLIELLIVVMLIAIFVRLFIPQAGSALRSQLPAAARVVTADLQYAAQRAIATRTLHRWVVDLDGQRFRIEEMHVRESEPAAELPGRSEALDLAPPRDEREYVPVGSSVGSWRTLDQSDVFVEAVEIGDDVQTEGIVGIAFGPDGGAEPAHVWLADVDENATLLRVLPFTGEVRVYEGPFDE